MMFVTLMLLAGTLQPTLTPASVPLGADKEKLICKREVPIGSLIASRKICLTAAQWERRAADGNAAARKMVQDGTGTLNAFNN